MIDELIFAFAFGVAGVSFIYAVCERMVEAMQDLEDEQEAQRLRKAASFNEQEKERRNAQAQDEES